MIQRHDWTILRDLFERTLRQPTAERQAFLRDNAPDPAVAAEVESLLAADAGAGDFMEQPALVRGPDAVSGDEESPRFAAGSRLGSFEILERLGSGGMGEVYRARDTRLDRFVAVKVLARDLDLTVRGRERFAREARAISKLAHPNICTVHDVGTAQVDGREVPFLVLELLTGETLAACLARGPLPLERALAASIDVAAALAAAHAQGVVHRDLKPSNVMITASGIKLLDFGVAELRTPDNGGDTPAHAAPLTADGLILGTPPYMSPEQLDGRRADARSDIFSFGTVLYEMLTGERASLPGHGPAALRAILPSAPLELERILDRCLQQDPARRYQSVADVKVALEAVHDRPRPAAIVRAVHLRPRQWAAVAAVVVAAAAVVTFVMWPRGAREPLPSPRVVSVTTLRGLETTPALAPDGDQVAFIWSGPTEDNSDLYVQRIDSGTEVRRTTHAAREFGPAWSPDGRWIAFLRGEVPGRSELILVPPLGGPERSLGEIQIRYVYAFTPYVAWFPDSRAVVVPDSAGPGEPEALVVVSIDSRERQRLTAPPPISADLAPAVSPDGGTVAFVRNAQLHLLSIGPDHTAASPPRLLSDVRAISPAWTPDGKEIVFVSGSRLWRVEASGGTPARPIAFVEEDAFMPALARSASTHATRLVFARMTWDADIWRLELPAAGSAPSSPAALVTGSTQIDANPQFSPEGTRIAFQSKRSGSQAIWIADPDGANAVQLTSIGAGAAGSPRWSPDGQWIAFDATLDGQWDVYIVAASGGRPRRMTFHPAEDSIPSFSRDSRFLYFTSKRSGAFEI